MNRRRLNTFLLWTTTAVMSLVVLPTLTLAVAAEPASGQHVTVTIDGKAILPSHGTAAGFWLFAENEDAQLVLMGHPPRRAVVSLENGHEIWIRVPVGPWEGKTAVVVRAACLTGAAADITLRLESVDGTSTQAGESFRINGATDTRLRLPLDPVTRPADLMIGITAAQGATSIRLSEPQVIQEGESVALAWIPRRRTYPQPDGVSCSPHSRPTIEQALIEWDWRMQDGIGTPNEPRNYAQAIETVLSRGEKLLQDLGEHGREWSKVWDDSRTRYNTLHRATGTGNDIWESLWYEVHRARREIVLGNPLADVGPLVFVKRVPSVMSHQLTQYYGYTAQPGGGLFVLEQPGQSMRVHRLTKSLPMGSYLHPEVSFDGTRIYFAFCECATSPGSWGDQTCLDRHYDLYTVNADDSGLRRLTKDEHDNFSPTYLPSGKLLFVSTRRGGFHRCGRGPCHVYTLSLLDSHGSKPRAISFHETNEWDPAVMNDGRVVYTRWDYVDRDAVFYQQLWTVRQDGSDPRIFYGNNTYNPVGTWEARPIPGSNKLMATAAPHHGMTAGSVILVDNSRGVDGLTPITRLTPDAPFPESEISLVRGNPVNRATLFDDEVAGGWGSPSPRSVERTETGRRASLAGPLLPIALSALRNLLPGGLQFRSTAR